MLIIFLLLNEMGIDEGLITKSVLEHRYHRDLFSIISLGGYISLEG